MLLMKNDEIRKMTPSDIDKKIIECKDELFTLRMAQASGTLRETHKIKELRKTVARLKTIKRELENGGN